MKEKTVFIVIAGSIAFLLFLGIVFSFLFIGVNPDLSVFSPGSVAVIELKGEISSDEGFLGSSASASDIVSLIKRADEDPSIRGILLEVNSGGGSVVASKEIVNALRNAKKPKLAYISDVGASGAYYAAAACNYVMADEDSLTGSIGAISIVLNFNELMKKYGVKAEVFKSGEHKDIGSPFREMSASEREIMDKIVKQAWGNFRDKILEFRGKKLDKSRLNEIFDGRIVTGKQALSYGLIDATGSEQDAVKKLGEMIGVENPTLRDFSPKKSILSYLSSMGYSFGKGFKTSLESDNISLRS